MINLLRALINRLRPIEKQLWLVQWLLPLILFSIVVAYETIEHIIERKEGISPNFLGEIWFFGILGPSIVWLVLRWIRGQWRERERVQADLRRAYDEMTQAQHELQALHAVRGQLLQKVIGAQEDERIRIARELHDELGQTLTGLNFALKLAEDALAADPVQAQSHLRRAQQVIEQLLAQTHHLTFDLRPAALDDMGLAAAIREYASSRLEPHGICVEVLSEGLAQRLPPTMETAMFRIVQEALTNVVRHAQAHQVTIHLQLTNGRLHARIEDDGRGFDPQMVSPPNKDGRGLGLLGMQERATLLGGNLQIESRAGGGTLILIQAPLPEWNGEARRG